MEKVNLRELALTNFKTAKGIVEGGRELVPMFFVETQEGALEIIAAPWRGDEEKYLTFAMLRKRLQETEARAYVFVSEIWMTKVEKGEQWDGTPPSENPQRIEAIMVNGNTTDGERFSMYAEIKTDEETGERRVLEPEIMKNTVMEEGRGVNLLLPEGRQAARH